MDQSKCPLFKLPTEIRHKLYGNVARLDIDHTVAERYVDGHSPEIGFFTTLVSNADAKLSLPWVHLRLTCKAVAEDLERYMSSPSFLKADENRTLVLDILAVRGRLESASLCKVPCQPFNIQVFVANLNFPERVKFWGCGGPMQIVRDLYQTLNWTLHYGPVFTRRTPLAQPLKLETMVVRVNTGEELREDGRVNEKFQRISNFIRTLRGTGLLCGYVENISVLDDLGHEKNYKIEQVKDACVPRGWDRYGFEWGYESKHNSTT